MENIEGQFTGSLQGTVGSPVVPNVQERQLFDVPIVVLMCTSVNGVLGGATKNIFYIICWKRGR